LATVIPGVAVRFDPPEVLVLLLLLLLLDPQAATVSGIASRTRQKARFRRMFLIRFLRPSKFAYAINQYPRRYPATRFAAAATLYYTF
jgi:hypothetical protein